MRFEDLNSDERKILSDALEEYADRKWKAHSVEHAKWQRRLSLIARELANEVRLA